jgi:hypothetical protein
MIKGPFLMRTTYPVPLMFFTTLQATHRGKSLDVCKNKDLYCKYLQPHPRKSIGRQLAWVSALWPGSDKRCTAVSYIL